MSDTPEVALRDEQWRVRPHHRIKIAPVHFNDVVFGIKRAEVRRHDRDYWVGDVLVLREWEHGKFTGREARAQITHILPGDQHGIAPGYSVLSISVVEVPDD